MDEFVTFESDSASDIFPNINLDLFPQLLEESLCFLENCNGYD